MASNQNEALSNRIQSESALNEISFYLKYFSSQGINVEDRIDENLNSTSLTGIAANRGYVRTSYSALKDFSATASAAPIDTVAIFLRDTLSSQYSTVPSIGDRFLPTGIYFQRPTAKTFGVLYIDLGRSLAAGNVTTSPSLDDLWYGSIVDFQVAEPAYSNFEQNKPLEPTLWTTTRRLSAVTFKITVREYLPQENSRRDYTWCPPSAMTLPECATTSPYKDVERIVRVTFRNNILGFSSTQMVKTTDQPVASRYQKKQFYSRPYDLIYFLKPNYPVGQLKRN
ncbi:hypothetical protein B9G69_007750 [Bdellovibrio sp. SKB1291214]|uniref:hypothetical protein n=1 Tax=Bdellovibrio sp. SKB1291214 TaxID=1732569 RepID=UPI0020CEC3A3|nr:hypothetical protein [Bdellovibrio sp. SKB1291214]UYL10469.1 hypothetical protein B9G69_007750 [Bdellovibrio sp. SKB1291214]